MTKNVRVQMYFNWPFMTLWAVAEIDFFSRYIAIGLLISNIRYNRYNVIILQWLEWSHYKAYISEVIIELMMFCVGHLVQTIHSRGRGRWGQIWKRMRLVRNKRSVRLKTPSGILNISSFCDANQMTYHSCWSYLHIEMLLVYFSECQCDISPSL